MTRMSDFTDIVVARFELKYPDYKGMPEISNNEEKNFLLYCMNTAIYDVTGIKYTFRLRETTTLINRTPTKTLVAEVRYKSVLVIGLKYYREIESYKEFLRAVIGELSFYGAFANEINYIDTHFPSLYRKLVKNGIGESFGTLIQFSFLEENIEALRRILGYDRRFIQFLCTDILGFRLGELYDFNEVMFNSKVYIVSGHCVLEKNVCEIADDFGIIDSVVAKIGLLEV